MKLPYHQIPDAPEDYSPGNVLARMIDGLGYRYYWATEGLTEANGEYRASEDSRTLSATLDHLFGLSSTIANTARGKANIRPMNTQFDEFEEQRKATLENIRKASEAVQGMNDRQLGDLEIVFQRGDKSSSFPLWNLINGPIADAIYHTGQVVAFRRAAGNPIHPGVNVFTGRTRLEDGR